MLAKKPTDSAVRQKGPEIVPGERGMTSDTDRKGGYLI